MYPFLKKLFTTGIQNTQNFQDKRNIIFLNQAGVVLVLITSSIFISNILFGFYLRSSVALGMLGILFLAYQLQRRHNYLIAKSITIGAIVTGTFISTYFFGAEAKTYYYLLASFCLSIFIFSKRSTHLFLFLIHGFAFGFFAIYGTSHTPVITGQDSEFLAYLHLPLVGISLFITLSEFVLHYKSYDARIIEVNEELIEHTELLEIEKSKFQIQTELLQMTNDQLHEEIKIKESTQQELLESNKALEQFAYVASHDLKEPLRTIGSFTQLLKRKLNRELDDKTEEYFNFVTDGVKRMSGLLDDLLALSRLNRKTDMSKIDMMMTMELNISNLNNAIEKNNGKVFYSDLPVIKANRSQMNQLFQNLISNGLKFKRDVPPVVEVNYKELQNHYLFSVRDNGVGIPETYQHKVFEIFQRLDKDARFEGTGIGLAICKKIVQIHGGEIWVESQPSEGSTFFFTISKHIEVNEEESDEQILENSYAMTA